MAKSGDSKLVIRRAGFDDIKPICAIGFEYAMETEWRKLGINLEKFAHMLADFINDDNAAVFAVVYDEVIVGYGMCRADYPHNDIPNGGIYNYYCLPEYRKHGAYRLLIKKLVDTLEAWQCGFIHVSIAPGFANLDKHLRLSENLFNKMGFERAGIVMRKVNV